MVNHIKALYIFIITVLFCSGAYLEISNIQGWIKEILLYALAIGGAFAFVIIRPSEALENISWNIVFWVLLYAISVIFAFAISSQSDKAYESLFLVIKVSGLFLAMLLVLTNPHMQKAALLGLIACIVVSGANNLYEFFSDSASWSTIPGRSAGWHLNPNRAAKTMVMSLIFASMIVSRKFFWPLVLITLIGIIPTFSRGGFIEFFMVVAGITIIRSAPLNKPLNLLNFSATGFLIMVFGLIVAVTFLLLVFSGEAYNLVRGTQFESYLSADVLQRLSGDFTDASASERFSVLLYGIQTGFDHPVIGAGLGHTHEWEHAVAPHNEYVIMFAERGLLGLSVYLGLYLLVWVSGGRYAKLFVLVMAFASVTTHNNLDQPNMMIFLALALLIRDRDFRYSHA